MKRGLAAPSAVIEEIGLDPRRYSGPAWPLGACRAGWENATVIAGFGRLAKFSLNPFRFQLSLTRVPRTCEGVRMAPSHAYGLSRCNKR